MKNPKPISKFILIKPKELKRAGGIVDPSAKDKDVEIAEALDVGSEVQFVKKGDTVIYKSYNLFLVELSKGNELAFLDEAEVLAIA